MEVTLILISDLTQVSSLKVKSVEFPASVYSRSRPPGAWRGPARCVLRPRSSLAAATSRVGGEPSRARSARRAERRTKAGGAVRAPPPRREECRSTLPPKHDPHVGSPEGASGGHAEAEPRARDRARRDETSKPSAERTSREDPTAAHTS